MLRLDLQTLVIVLIALCIAIGASLVSIAGRRRGTGTLWYWGLSLLTLACGSLLLVLRGTIPLLVSIMAGNALVICAVALLGNVASSLTKKFLDGTNRWFFAAATAPVLGLLYLAVEPIWPRVAYMAAVECYLVGQLAWQLRKSRIETGEPQRKSAFAFEILLWIFLAETAIRVVSTVVRTPEDGFFQQSSVAVAFLVAILLVAIGTCILIWHELDVKNDAIAQSTDTASGLPNRAVFMQLLEGRLASMTSTGGGSIALLRVRLSLKEGAHLDPAEEATVLRKAGTRIDQFLDQSDVLARVDDDEFGVLFRGTDIARAVQSLERALTSLQSRAIAGERGQYHMNGAAALMASGPSAGSTAFAIKTLHDGLDGVPMGEVRILTMEYPGAAGRANGTDGS